MADDNTKRTTSFSKSLDDLVKYPSPLDNVPPELRKTFARYAEELKQIAQHEKEGRGEQERQSEERAPTYSPRPEPHLRPEGPTRRAVDRKIDYEKIRKIAAAVRKRREAARGLSRDFDRER